MNSKRKALIQQFIIQNQLTGTFESLLDQALTHKSYSNEIKGDRFKVRESEKHNQRLEFLGDAILGLIIAQALYEMLPDANEGELTKKKSVAVCEPTLGEIGERLEIGKYLLMGKGEIQTGGTKRISNIADALEAVIASIFLSAGIEAARAFVMKQWMPYLNEAKIAMFSVDHKSILQEIIVKSQKVRPEYRVIATEGPEHKKSFIVGLYINGQEIGRANANSRKKAEQKAAYDYLIKHNLLK